MIWLFDLDNTLYPYASGMYQHINILMNEFLKRTLKVSLNKVDKIRKQYVKEYGTTLLGMIINHNIDPFYFLKEIHSFNIGSFIKKEPELQNFLKKLPGIKYIFTNSPLFYAKNVLNILGIEDVFKSIYSIECFEYYGKPYPSSYQKVLNLLDTKEQINFVDDEEKNVKMAEKFGFHSILVDSRRFGLDNYYSDELMSKLEGFK